MPLSNYRIHKIQPNIIKNYTNKRINVTKNKKEINQDNQKQLKINVPNALDRIEKIWNGDTVYIIGGGPSLKDFDWSRLSGKKIIAINRAFQVLPNADVLYWTDSRFYKWYKKEIDNFKGLKVTCRPILDNPGDIIVLKPTSSLKFDDRMNTISSGNNSGFGAINLAIKLGAKKIYLLGYDMISYPNQTHWHDGYQITHNHTIYDRMIVQFSFIAEDAKKMNIEIYNANLKSRLDVFKKVSLDDAINDSV